MAVADPTLDVESELHHDGARFIIGCDEVGRGAIAGPVGVGVCVVDRAIIERGVGEIPPGLRDSKMLSEKRREVLAPLAAGWASYSAVGLASAAEVDEFGIIAALGMAGKRALAHLHGAGASILDSVILLDGSHDWLSPALTTPLRVRTRIKADRDCASVAAASVVAKVFRDRMMIAADLDHPGYGWAGNKGYGSAAHFEAISRLGASPLHRHTWLHAVYPDPAAGLDPDFPLDGPAGETFDSGSDPARGPRAPMIDERLVKTSATPRLLDEYA